MGVDEVPKVMPPNPWIALLVVWARASAASEHTNSTPETTSTLCMIEDTPALAAAPGAKGVPQALKRKHWQNGQVHAVALPAAL
jgi:hypothetical protein